MGSSTSWYLAGFLLSICSGTLAHTEFSDTVPECSVSWQVDWNGVPNIGMEFFQTPGEIVDGVTVRDALAFLGLAWNAPSWQEIVGLACMSYGPLLNEVAGEDIVRRECDVILRSLRTRKRIRIKNDCISALEETEVGAYSTSPLGFYQTGDANLDELETVTNLSPIVFELLEWLTPSPFSSDSHGACSALRIMLGMPVEDIITRLKTICVYPMAVILESFSDRGICVDLEPGSKTAFEVAILDILAGSSVPTCQFFSSNPTDEEFVERATTIVDNAVAFLTDRGICVDILSTVTEYLGDDTGVVMYFNLTTGATLDSASSREMLCRNTADAFDPDSSFVPEPYVLPEGTRLENLTLVFGEILPGFSFEDYLDVAGAFRRADTLAGGMVVYCDVFETVFVQETPETARDFEQMCDSLRAMNFATVEDKCLDMLNRKTGPIYTGGNNYDANYNYFNYLNTIPPYLGAVTPPYFNYYYYDTNYDYYKAIPPSEDMVTPPYINYYDTNYDYYNTIPPFVEMVTPPYTNDYDASYGYYNTIPRPLSVRMLTPYYMGAIGLEFYRKLFDPTRISVEDTCGALDSFFNSDNNLESVTRLAVDVWLAELIPMAHRICEDYDAVYDYYNATIWGGQFPIIERFSTAVILVHLGFESRENVCEVIAGEIEPSGRATDVVVGTFQKALLEFLTNESRCEASMDAVLSGLELGGIDDVDNLFSTYTGYDSTSAACRELQELFTTELCDTGDGSIPRSQPALLLAILVQTILMLLNVY